MNEGRVNVSCAFCSWTEVGSEWVSPHSSMRKKTKSQEGYEIFFNLHHCWKVMEHLGDEFWSHIYLVEFVLNVKWKQFIFRKRAIFCFVNTQENRDLEKQS